MHYSKITTKDFTLSSWHFEKSLLQIRWHQTTSNRHITCQKIPKHLKCISAWREIAIISIVPRRSLIVKGGNALWCTWQLSCSSSSYCPMTLKRNQLFLLPLDYPGSFGDGIVFLWIIFVDCIGFFFVYTQYILRSKALNNCNCYFYKLIYFSMSKLKKMTQKN